MSEAPTYPAHLESYQSRGLELARPSAPVVTVRDSQKIRVQTVVHPEAPSYFRYREWFERLVALLMLVPALPVIGCLMLLVRSTSRGPGLYRQQRVGKDNQVFTIYKIRTMVNNAEQKTGAVWAKPQDCRVTWVGRILRTLHLDEIPQLFNVVRGEMSLVGPRPERPEIIAKLAEEVENYHLRHLVPPGITGLAQLNLPADTDLDSVRRKLYLDLQYIREANFWLDLRLVLSTAPKLLAVNTQTSLRWFRLRREVPEQREELVKGTILPNKPR